MLSFSSDLVFSVLLASCLAVVAAAVLLFFPIARRQGASRQVDRGITFLFHGDDLIDASPPAEALLPHQGKGAFTWGDACAALSPRFPGLPTKGADARQAAPASFPSSVAQDNASVELECLGENVRLSLWQGHDSHCVVLHHQALVSQIKLHQLSKVLETAPYPVWCLTRQGAISWSNAAYRSLARILNKPMETGAPEKVFCLDPNGRPVNEETRISLSDGDKTLWFKITRADVGEWMICHAQDISEVVKAEKTQRAFVQTLTKTFAQLGTGLAIFDRDHRLVLFNPALVDLTRLPADFLSARPSLSAFFDWLRESRVMPEPKNYGAWRDKLNELTQAAAAGTFSELWSLPNGMSFRVLGRPHPDGAIAFLFEDVTAELSLTRNFVKELEINYSLLDTLGSAIVVFSASGQALFANKSYQDLWGADPNQDLLSITLQGAVESWIQQVAPGKCVEVLASLQSTTNQKKAISGEFTLLDGREFRVKATPLAKGATAVIFISDPAGQSTDQPEDQDIFA